MSKSLEDTISQELLDELQDVQESNPRLVELIITMISAIGETLRQVDNLTKLPEHLEVSRLDHEWKLNTLKDITVRNMHGSDSAVPTKAEKEPTIH